MDYKFGKYFNMNRSQFASVIYHSFCRLYKVVRITTKCFQSLFKVFVAARQDKSTNIRIVGQIGPRLPTDYSEPRWRKETDDRFWRPNELLWRRNEPLRRKNEPLWRENEPLRRNRNEPLRRNQNEALWRNQNKPLRRKQNDEKTKTLLEQFSVKPVVVHEQNNVSSTQNDVCNSGICYRSTVREFIRWPNVRRCRDRELSRIPVKKIMSAMRKRKNRERIKRILKRSTPKSSILNELATNYKDYYYRSYLKLWHRHNFFTQTFLPFKHSGKVQKSIPTAQNYSICVSNRSSMPGKCNFADKQHYVAEKKLLLSGDIELNPGPVQNENTQARITLPSYLLLEQRLGQFQMRPLDVGGAGDCFFRAVSHQLYGDPSHHLDIRDAGIAYMRENPERFIESNTDYSWEQYLNSMSIQSQ